MAASVNDKFRKASGSTTPVVTSLALPKANGATTASLTSATGWNTTTGLDYVIYRRELNTTTGLYQEVAGTRVAGRATLSGTTLSAMTIDEGTEPASGYAADGNTVVMCAATAQWADDFVDGILAGHSQAGAHNFTQVIDSNGNETVKLAGVASAVNEVTLTNAIAGVGPSISATGGDTNIDMNLVPKGTGKLKVGGNPFDYGAYASWTPAWTGFTIGNATVVARYNQTGKRVEYTIDITCGSTTALVAAADAIYTLPPVTAISTGKVQYVTPLGAGVFNDLSASQLIDLSTQWYSTTQAMISYKRGTGTGTTILLTAFNPTNAPTLSAGDFISVHGSYEAA